MSHLANHHREIPATSLVITMDCLPEPRFRGVSMPNRCDDRGFSWVDEVGESDPNSEDVISGTYGGTYVLTSATLAPMLGRPLVMQPCEG